MRNVIMIGCDLHDKTMLLKIATDRDEPSTRSVKNTQTGQATMIRDLKAQAAAADVAEKKTRVKTQIQSLLKRNRIRRDPESGSNWTQRFRRWLKSTLCESPESPLGPRSQATLLSLLRQLTFLEEEQKILDEQIIALVAEDRYIAAYEELTALCGGGVLRAIVFLTELGDVGTGSPRSGREESVPANRQQKSQEEENRRGGIDATFGGENVASWPRVSRPTIAQRDPLRRGSAPERGTIDCELTFFITYTILRPSKRFG